MLTMGRYGKSIQILGAIGGGVIAAFAIYMERRAYWSMSESIVWFAIAIPVIGVPLQWMSWRDGTLEHLVAMERVDAKQPMYLALALAIFAGLYF